MEIFKNPSIILTMSKFCFQLFTIYNLVYIWHYANQDHHKKTDVHAGNFFFGVILYQAIANKIGHIKP